ncbi:ABC transporter ATP-binding protein [Microbacterium sp. zg.B48]|uniref:dipeptide ABC transporter ATP-binding protein n=1 Tax=Microbacterium sp. zg.B48 TaxID=2969408 RepID=UPI00214C00FA|nr:ABC transporter ATP-binding protein [Microbacterium sp. zg.B48]MCR2763765.1 ABC transporter ATP-binding protein [Microbacterium sp. zg.B48]
MSALEVRGLRIVMDGRVIVDGVELSVAPGECLAIVGESGAGKSMTAHALLGLAPDRATVTADVLSVDGVDVSTADERAWRGVRGSRIALVSQDALVSLDPLRRIGREIEEPLEIHTGDTRARRRERALAALESVSMPDASRRIEAYSHELSGGLRQRALIASALVTNPRIVVADEPTTALDATVQLRILQLLREIVDAGTALVVISHDLTAVAHVADRIAVMRAGKIVEEGATAEVLAGPGHPHTRELVAAWRIRTPPRSEPSGQIVLAAQGLSKSFAGSGTVVHDVSLALRRGSTLGIVGESGSGKTTLARLLMGIESPDAGEVTLEGAMWNPATEARRRPSRSRIQLVHQNPRAAFDPRWSIGRSLSEALRAGGVARAASRHRVAALLEQVELDPGIALRRPGEVSGGQRQRAAIARALAVGPDILILDEPVSALDASVQVTVLALLNRLQRETGIAMILISHDLRVVAAVADEIMVMRDGRVVEAGSTAEVFREPRHPFTRALLRAGKMDGADRGEAPGGVRGYNRLSSADPAITGELPEEQGASPQ